MIFKKKVLILSYLSLQKNNYSKTNQVVNLLFKIKYVKKIIENYNTQEYFRKIYRGIGL